MVLTHAHTRAQHTHINIHTHTHTHTQTHTLKTHIHTYTHTHAHTRAQDLTQKHTHAHAHIQKHTHTHTRPLAIDVMNIILASESASSDNFGEYDAPMKLKGQTSCVTEFPLGHLMHYRRFPSASLRATLETAVARATKQLNIALYENTRKCTQCLHVKYVAASRTYILRFNAMVQQEHYAAHVQELRHCRDVHTRIHIQSYIKYIYIVYKYIYVYIIHQLFIFAKVLARTVYDTLKFEAKKMVQALKNASTCRQGDVRTF
jgi:hypothetical protein